MSTELLIQILVSVSIIAIVCLIVLFWRIFSILSDINEITKIAKKRADQVDAGISKFEANISSGLDALKGFVYSLEFIKSIREKIEGYKKGEK